MLFGLSLILLIGLLFSKVCEFFRLPPLLGMLISGIILGPYGLSLLEPNLLAISADLRKIALIIILTRVGLNLNIKDLQKIGLPAFFMCFVPACFEILAMIVIAPRLFPISPIEAALMGAVIAAVSPAVIVPKMLGLMEQGYGKKKGIPQLIMAGASMDDIFVIVLFSALLSLAQGQAISYQNFLAIPLSIFFGLIIGAILGTLLPRFFSLLSLSSNAQVIFLLGLSIFCSVLEDGLTGWFHFSSLVAIITIGLCLQKKSQNTAKELSLKYNNLWAGAEILLFSLVGATVDLSYALKFGYLAALLIVFVLIFRVLGVFLCLWKTNFNGKEKLFSMIAYCPKATVQAAIGSIPLAMGLPCGNLVLTVAVLSILITAPLGALAIDLSYEKLLKKDA